MFDSEQIETVLITFCEVGIYDDMLALVYEANNILTFAVKRHMGCSAP